MRAKLGRDDLILEHSHPYLYLNREAISSANLDAVEVEQFIANTVVAQDGIMYALTRSQLLSGELVDAPIQDQIRRSFHPTRSGDIHMIQDQYWFLHSTEEAEKLGIGYIAAIHGSPWEYDTYVPIFFAGYTVPPQTITRPVGPQDIAPTLASCMNVKPPSGSVGNPLAELLPCIHPRE